MRIFTLLATWGILLSLVSVQPVAADQATLCEQEEADGFVLLFNGVDLEGWHGGLAGYAVEEGVLVCQPRGGKIFTDQEYANFVFRFEFRLPEGANNGIGLRCPRGGNPAFQAMECQVLDDSAERYADLHDYQYHGSIYGVVASERGWQSPVGEWNEQEIICDGRNVKVTLNGHVIVDANLDEATREGTIDGRAHPGLNRQLGTIGLLGHNSSLEFRNLRIKELPASP